MHFNIILKNFFEGGGAQNLTLPPGASYPRYATGRCRGPGSISSGLTLTLREDCMGLQAGPRDTLSCKDRHQPTGPHGHVSGPLV